MFTRTITRELTQFAQQYLIITINESWQTGKTTLVKAVFADKAYVNLEEPDIREIAEN